MHPYGAGLMCFFVLHDKRKSKNIILKIFEIMHNTEELVHALPLQAGEKFDLKKVALINVNENS